MIAYLNKNTNKNKMIINFKNSSFCTKVIPNISKYFSEILPEYHEDRVYASDMKKVIQWYNLLHKRGIVNFDTAVASAGIITFGITFLICGFALNTYFFRK